MEKSEGERSVVIYTMSDGVLVCYLSNGEAGEE